MGMFVTSIPARRDAGLVLPPHKPLLLFHAGLWPASRRRCWRCPFGLWSASSVWTWRTIWCGRSSPELAPDAGAVPSGVASARRGLYLVQLPSPVRGLMGSGLSRLKERVVQNVLDPPSCQASVDLTGQASPLASANGPGVTLLLVSLVAYGLKFSCHCPRVLPREDVCDCSDVLWRHGRDVDGGWH